MTILLSIFFSKCWRRYRLITLLALSITQCGYGIHKRDKTDHSSAKIQHAGQYKVGKPYHVNGEWYHPKEDRSYDETGMASWYGPGFHGKRTANGAVFKKGEITAAHRTLPLPSMVRVTNLHNGRSVEVMVNDRGPFSKKRIIDVSESVAELLAIKRQGVAKVRVQYLPIETNELYANLGIKTNMNITKELSTDASIQALEGKKNILVQENSYQDKEIQKKLQQSPELVPVIQNGVYVQVGAFVQEKTAKQIGQKLLSIHNKVDISSVRFGEQILHRVRIGPLNADKAPAYLTKIQKAGYQTALITHVH
jgi:rare lipoprotein A